MIGIICNFYVKNYGSVLQSLALQNVLNELGIENEIINYEQKADKNDKLKIFFKIRIKNIFNLKKIKSKIYARNHNSLYKDYAKIVNKRNEVFDFFVKNSFNLSKEFKSIEDINNSLEKYTGILLGSDQLWCPSDLIIGYHTLEFLPNDIYKATYATSFGVERLDFWMKKIVSEFISKIDDVSVRELSGAKIIDEVCKRKVPSLIDPTLLMSKEEWDKMVNCERKIKDKYIFCYFLSTNQNMRNWANELKMKTGYKLVSFPCVETFCPEDMSFSDKLIYDANPYELISIIRGAEYIVSDSFHVSVFSSIYGKKFLVFDRFKNDSADSRNTRIDNLLSITGLQARHYDENRDIFEQIKENINYEDVWKILKLEREKSLKYIMMTIGGRK